MTINRFVGPTLVNATRGELSDCIRRGGYRVLKVTATDKYGLVNEGWTPETRKAVCDLTRWTIVRTQTGDGTANDAGDYRYLNPQLVRSELEPWYEAKRDSVHKINDPNSPTGWSNLLIELGNEPNNAPLFISTFDPKVRDEIMWGARYWLLKSIDMVKQLDQEYQVTTKIICTAMAPWKWDIPWEADNWNNKTWVERWLRVYGTTDVVEGRSRNAVDECNFLGLHFFTKYGWAPIPDPAPSDLHLEGNNYNFMVDTYTSVFGSRRLWIVTEFGIRCPPERANERGSQCNDVTKGRRNAELLHFGEPSYRPLPSHVWGGTYFALNTKATPPVDPETGTPADPWSGDWGYTWYYPNGDSSYKARLDSSDRLGINERLDRGAPPLSSPDGRYKLYLQAGDGNLVLYNAAGVAIWSTYRPGGDFLVLQPDANLVVYRNTGEALWNAGTYGSGADALVLQNDGNLVLYSRAGPVWATNTVGR